MGLLRHRETQFPLPLVRSAHQYVLGHIYYHILGNCGACGLINSLNARREDLRMYSIFYLIGLIVVVLAVLSLIA